MTPLPPCAHPLVTAPDPVAALLLSRPNLPLDDPHDLLDSGPTPR